VKTRLHQSSLTVVNMDKLAGVNKSSVQRQISIAYQFVLSNCMQTTFAPFLRNNFVT